MKRDESPEILQMTRVLVLPRRGWSTHHRGATRSNEKHSHDQHAAECDKGRGAHVPDRRSSMIAVEQRKRFESPSSGHDRECEGGRDSIQRGKDARKDALHGSIVRLADQNSQAFFRPRARFRVPSVQIDQA